MPKTKATQLRKIYDRACAARTKGEVVDDAFMMKTLGLTKFGASCVRYMLEQGRYYPELEGYCHWTDAPFLSPKQGRPVDLIELRTDLPPFKQGDFLDAELSPESKALYVRLGIARRWLPDEFRRHTAKTFIRLERLSQQYCADLREAIAQGDAAYVRGELKNKSETELRQTLKKLEFTRAEIEAALKLRRSGA